MTTQRTSARGLGSVAVLALGFGAACTYAGTSAAEQDLAIACATACLDERDDSKNVIKKGDNYWIGMTDNKANQQLVDWMEQYCQALDDKAGCFGTHGGGGGELQVRPCGAEIGAVKDGPPYLLLICSAAEGPNSALDWFVGQTCSASSEVIGCTGTIWVQNPKGTKGKSLHCQGEWKNGDGPVNPSFTGSGITFTKGDVIPVGVDWLPVCG